MSELILVRHGQASFGAASYDKLSPLGIEQVQELAEFWRTTGQSFDHIISGSLLRQRETAAELLGLIAGTPQEPEINSAFNEYNGDPLLKVYLRDHGSADGYQGIEWPIRDPRLFQQVFEVATAKWIRGELKPTAADTEFEYWQDFQARVHAAIDEILLRFSGGKRVVLATSGGVIAMTLQRVLDFPDHQVISTNWMVHNSSVTRLRFGGGRISLSQFNSLPHLERDGKQQMITYR